MGQLRIRAATGVGVAGLVLGGFLLFPTDRKPARWDAPASRRPAAAAGPRETSGPAAQEAPNELAGARSPYLRSAAGQPVEWHRWGDAAFRLARELDRPVWLDVGAIWCHWCHVMDRESYENPRIARLINENFVAIKVDRDQRPDIDLRYQAAQQALNGRGGGWPLTLWLTPAGQPFAGGTYFPPSARGGQPGLEEIIPQLVKVYHEERGRVKRITAALGERLDRLRKEMSLSGALSPDLPRRTAEGLASAYDTAYGGFGDGQKFPHPAAVRFALAQGVLGRDTSLVALALHTLDAYDRSGLRDYVNGGFFRYATDRALTVPHFEKMDYVQAGLLRAYLDAFRLTGRVTYAGAAREILRYADAALADRDEGGFYAHQDADLSPADDGSFYTWSVTQLRGAVSPETFEAVRIYYDVRERGEMREDPSQNVLRVARSPAEVAAELGVTEAVARERIRTGTGEMAGARAGWKPPLVERTKFTDRNGLMISAYVEAYEALGDTVARAFALQTVEFLLSEAVGPGGRVFHATTEEGAHTPGFLTDYAALAEALANAYQVSGRRRYLYRAEEIMDRAVQLFWDDEGGGFFDRPAARRGPGLLARPSKEFLDSPQPGGNAVAAGVLEMLYLLTTRERWRTLAERTLAAFAGSAARSGVFAATYGLAATAHLSKPPQVVVIGAPADPRSRELAAAARRAFRPGRVVTTFDPATAALDSLPDAIAAAARAVGPGGRPRAFVCVGRTCAPPTSTPATVASLVREYGRPAPR
ncbi:MAG: thioredoxin domain-containing protein [Gemmatimonadota bacterium]